MSTTYQPQEAHYFDLVNKTLDFTPDELAMLQKNGFVVSDRLRFPQFKRGYAYIYWKDWPVLVTTDSILHAIHQTYDHIFQQLESDILQPKLVAFLSAIYQQLGEDDSYKDDPRLIALVTDLKTYLSVPLLVFGAMSTDEANDVANNVNDAIRSVNHLNRSRRPSTSSADLEPLRVRNFEDRRDLTPPSTPQKIHLFGVERTVDFAAFQARGHYDEDRFLTLYFGAMMWLALIDFCMVSYDKSGQPKLHVEQIAAARLLYETIAASGQRTAWDEIDRLLTAFIGWSDNITLNGLDQFWDDAGITNVEDCFSVAPQYLLNLLTTRDYGQQRIAAQALTNRPLEDKFLPNPISFMLMGQRFTVESLIMTEVIFDKLIVNGQKIPRAFPSALDVMYALGNDQSAEHLQSEFNRYHHHDVLNHLREVMATYSHEFWESSFYNLWLNMILMLNQNPTGDHVPTTLKGDIWKDKMLHTQLGSWAELRHDHILYTKPPRPIYAGCEYPTGYVEPYPAFYEAVADFARYGRLVFADLNTAGFQTQQLDFYRTVQEYFELLEEIAAQLKTLADKELQGAPFTTDEALFVKSVVVRKYVGVQGYGGSVEEAWDGWYNDLLPFGDYKQAIVTDIHINMEPALGPTGVFHIGTGDPAVIALLVGEGQEQTVYIGPSFTYYECLEPSNHRLSDWEWEERFRAPSYDRLGWLKQEAENEIMTERQVDSIKKEIDKQQAEIGAARPVVPAWTANFRIPNPKRTFLNMPKREPEN
jgi:hypothetical protein